MAASRFGEVLSSLSGVMGLRVLQEEKEEEEAAASVGELGGGGGDWREVKLHTAQEGGTGGDTPSLVWGNGCHAQGQRTWVVERARASSLEQRYLRVVQVGMGPKVLTCKPGLCREHRGRVEWSASPVTHASLPGTSVFRPTPDA